MQFVIYEDLDLILPPKWIKKKYIAIKSSKSENSSKSGYRLKVIRNN